MPSIASQIESVEDTVMDENTLTLLLRTLEKRIAANQLMRTKYPSQPDKFLSSEMELHSCIEEFYTVAAYPELYKHLVDGNGIKTLLGTIYSVAVNVCM